MTEAELAAYSYTEAAGKRPKYVHVFCYRWTLPDPPSHNAPEDIPKAIFDRLQPDPRAYPQPWLFRTAEAALAAADEAYRRAWREGAMGPITQNP